MTFTELKLTFMQNDMECIPVQTHECVINVNTLSTRTCTLRVKFEV